MRWIPYMNDDTSRSLIIISTDQLYFFPYVSYFYVRSALRNHTTFSSHSIIFSSQLPVISQKTVVNISCNISPESLCARTTEEEPLRAT